MIVVLGSRHDPVARSLAATLPHGALCGAEDLTQPGWSWPLNSPEPRRWVVDGRCVDDAAVAGVLVRRNRVHPEELLHTHPEDREYLAAETTAFLGFVLMQTGARVVNRPVDGAIGDEALRPERWMPAAAALGIGLAPLRMSSDEALALPRGARAVEVAAGRAFDGDERHAALAAALALDYVALVLDEEDRLLALSTLAEPSLRARTMLAALCAGGPRP